MSRDEECWSSTGVVEFEKMSRREAGGSLGVEVGMMDVSRKTEANFGRRSSTNCGRSWYQVSEKRSPGMGRRDTVDVVCLCMADNSRRIE